MLKRLIRLKYQIMKWRDPKVQIRNIITSLKLSTDTWVVPHEFYQLVDKDQYDEAQALLDSIDEKWHDDGEYTYASAFLFSLANRE